MTTTKAIRNLVAKLANVHPAEIQLSEIPLSPDFVPQNNCGHSWWGGAEEEYDTIFGVSLANNVCKKLRIEAEYHFSENGSVSHSEGQELAKYLAESKEHYEMFLVNHSGKEYGDEGEEYNYWRLYKSPNFPEYWKGVNEEDIKRWENWINDAM